MSTVAPEGAAAFAPLREPRGEIEVCDPNPLNWLFITWNTMEEPIRTDQEGRAVGALCEDPEWIDERTLEVRVREGVRFQDGTPCTAENVRRNFAEVQTWSAPHPPGTWLNFHPDTRCEVVDERTARFHFPEVDGLAVAKFRGFHIASDDFWEQWGFGYTKSGSGEGHW